MTCETIMTIVSIILLILGMMCLCLFNKSGKHWFVYTAIGCIVVAVSFSLFLIFIRTFSEFLPVPFTQSKPQGGR